MVFKTKKKNVTSKILKAKTEMAIGAFQGIILALRSNNEDAAKAKADNEEQIAMLEQENSEIDTITARNNKIINNIENLFTA